MLSCDLRRCFLEPMKYSRGRLEEAFWLGRRAGGQAARRSSGIYVLLIIVPARYRVQSGQDKFKHPPEPLISAQRTLQQGTQWSCGVHA